MTDWSRRRFLRMCGSSVVVAGLPVACRRESVPPASDLVGAARIIDGPLERKQAFAAAAFEVAKRRGATFADVRVVRARIHTVVARDHEIVGVAGEWHYGPRPDRVWEKEDIGFNVRVLKNGAWGFAASPVLTEDEVRTVAAFACDLAEASARTKVRDVQLVPEPAYVDTYVTPHKEDPFQVPLDEKIGLLLEVNERVQRNPKIDRAFSWLDFWDENKYYANSEGSSIQQRIIRSDGSFFARANVNGVRAQRRYWINPLNIGYEHIRAADLVAHADQTAAEAVEKAMAAPPGSERRTTVIMDPKNLCLLVHESVGHPTELNRTVLVETNFAGSTLLSPGDLGKYRFGSKIMHVVADRNRPTLRATCGYDDEGVKTQEWDVIREGLLVGFQTTRDFATYINEPRSRGCCLTEAWDRVPQSRIPNVSLIGGANGSPTPDELIADTKDGVLVTGFDDFIIQDCQRRNFTFTGNAIWEIKKGKKTRMLRNLFYNGDSFDIWGSLQAVSHRDFWEPTALDSDDIGQPSQRNHNSHGAPWGRFINLKVGGPAI